MARLKRFVSPGHPHLVLQRAAPGVSAFAESTDYEQYLSILEHVVRVERVSIHAYSLTPRAVRLLVTPSTEKGLSRMMQGVGRAYVSGFNRRHSRAGTIWQGRFNAAPVEAETQLVDAMRLVEEAPVVEGLAAQPVEYGWSSAQHHVGASSTPMLADHASYWRLGNTPFDREARYRLLLSEPLDASTRLRLERADKGWAVGSGDFVAAVSSSSDRRGAPRPAGRPAVSSRAAGGN